MLSCIPLPQLWKTQGVMEQQQLVKFYSGFNNNII